MRAVGGLWARHSSFFARSVGWPVLVVLFTLVAAKACSPGWTPDVFVRKYRPDVPRDFYGGKLGILQETYYRFNLVAAYRYLKWRRAGKERGGAGWALGLFVRG